jgi:hypothetical protein
MNPHVASRCRVVENVLTGDRWSCGTDDNEDGNDLGTENPRIRRDTVDERLIFKFRRYHTN